MAGKYTDAQARASRKYQEKTVTIQIRVTEEQRTKYKLKAKELNMSLAEYIRTVLEEA